MTKKEYSPKDIDRILRSIVAESKKSKGKISIDDIEKGTYTVKDLEDAGWVKYREAWSADGDEYLEEEALKYLSEKANIDKQNVQISDSGEVYYIAPSSKSTTNYVRIYMRPKKKS